MKSAVQLLLVRWMLSRTLLTSFAMLLKPQVCSVSVEFIVVTTCAVS